MLLAPDKTGFPLLVVPEVELEVHLLPVTKLQIEQFIIESDKFGAAWYQELLTLNPPIAYDHLQPDNREQLFISGILPVEALAFARWLGEGFDLPTFAEWRAIYAAFRRDYFPSGQRFFEWAAEPVGVIVEKLLDHHPRHTMRELSLMQGGLVEWVRYGDNGNTGDNGDNWLGLGAPRPAFHPNLWDPAKNYVRPLRPDKRLSYFGFRLVRRGQWDVANKPGGIYLF